ncbi:MAG: hypothetical protein HOH13_05740 [Crocinitomicaceae bacterium]|jgi:hypothetical protein|nr:hypothetical protein [Crocinitomicaceae bacterium]MBT5401942.1 hypothetical protein [Crocinitomicaceae bacterium]MBT6029787.1 hypothetical protein [Crocinitomicaceae bacterium]MBT6515414.1 hypothetical protein [Crocinitomicaceae bacterium]
MKHLLVFLFILPAISSNSQIETSITEQQTTEVVVPQKKLPRYTEHEVVTIGDTYIYLRNTMRPLNGIVYKQWTNDSLMSECAYEQGLLNGPCKRFYRSGKIKFEGNYVNGIKNGICREWHENGQLSTEESYLKGKKEGLCRLWFEDGELFEEELFKEGNLIAPN